MYAAWEEKFALLLLGCKSECITQRGSNAISVLNVSNSCLNRPKAHSKGEQSCWHCKLAKNHAGEFINPRGEPTATIVLSWCNIQQILDTYPSTHRLVHLLPFVHKVSFCRRSNCREIEPINVQKTSDRWMPTYKWDICNPIPTPKAQEAPWKRRQRRSKSQRTRRTTANGVFIFICLV